MNENNENKMAPVDYAKSGLMIAFMGAALAVGFRAVDAGWNWIGRKIEQRKVKKQK